MRKSYWKIVNAITWASIKIIAMMVMLIAGVEIGLMGGIFMWSTSLAFERSLLIPAMNRVGWMFLLFLLSWMASQVHYKS